MSKTKGFKTYYEENQDNTKLSLNQSHNDNTLKLPPDSQINHIYK